MFRGYGGDIRHFSGVLPLHFLFDRVAYCVFLVVVHIQGAFFMSKTVFGTFCNEYRNSLHFFERFF